MSVIPTTLRKCFNTPPGSANRQGVTIKVGVRGWLSHQLSSAVLEIILKEYLGFGLIAYDLSATQAADWGQHISAGKFDVDVESMEVVTNKAAYAKYITTDKTVADAGPVGYKFKKGLYTTSAVLKTHPFANWWLFYNNTANIQAGNFVMFGQDGVSGKCDTSTYSWCGTGSLAGYWAPKVCQASPASCAVAIMETPGAGFDVARFEQMTANLQLKLVHAYAGSSHAAKVKSLAASGKQVVFSSWNTHTLPIELKAKRISFPQWVPFCDTDMTKDPTGSIMCDIGDTNLHKIMTTRLKKDAPEAHLMLSRFTVFLSDIEGMIRKTKSAGGLLTPYEAACEHVKANNATIFTLLPSCVIHPPLKPQTGDEVFDPFEMKCVPVIRFPATPLDQCYSPGTRPGTVDRSGQLVKVCFQGWLSQNLASSTVGMILRDFLGYTVQKIDLRSSKTSLIYENIAGGACDVDIESWQGAKTNPKYIDHVVQRRVVKNPGDLGYLGQSGMFLTPDLARENKMASFWKFYTNITNLSNVKILKFGQFEKAPGHVPTYMNYGGKSFCTSSFCIPSGIFKDYWVPPQCQYRPEQCAIAMHPVSNYDTAYLETLTKDLGLNIIHAYYGWNVASLIKNISKHGFTNVLHYWWTPDPLIGGSPEKTRPVRLTYPSYAFGCQRQYTRDPNTGSMTCDYPGAPMEKLISAAAADRMPEAYYTMQNLKITLSDVREMMTNHTESDGKNTTYEVVCEWIKRHEAKIKKLYAPDCVSNPKPVQSLKIGDSVWDPATKTCVTIACAVDQVILTGKTGVSCKTCGPGLRPNANKTDCEGCPAGETPLRKDPGGCQPCPKGYFCRYGAESPVECEKGSYSGKQKQLECSRCERGKYQDKTAQSSCTACPLSMTTLILGARLTTDCVCPSGKYKPLNATNATGHAKDPTKPACNECPPGMQCEEGSDEINIPCKSGALDASKATTDKDKLYPVPKEQHFAQCKNPLSCYKCLSVSACPGLDIEVCGEGMEGIACGRCMNKWYRLGDKCRKCNDVETSNVVFPALPAAIAPLGVIFFYLVSRDTIEKWNSPANSFAAGLFVTLIYIQTLAAISACYLNKPSAMEESNEWTSYTYDLMSLMRPGCTTFSDFKTSFIGKLMLPAWAFVYFAITFLASLLVGLCARRFRMEFDMINNCFFALFNTFFIGIAQQTFTLFQCYKHPNGEKSMRSQADVLCSSDVWTELMGIAVAAVIIFCGGFFAINIVISILAPRRFHIPAFRKRWKFVFIKYRPSCWWWGIVLLTKGIWLNLPTVVFDYGAAQILWLQSVIVCYLVFVFSFMPWRNFTVAVLDIMFHAACIFLFGFVTHFTDQTQTSHFDLGSVYSGVSNAPVGVGGLVCLWCVYRRFRPAQSEEFWRMTADKVSSTFSKAKDLDDVSRMLPKLPFSDMIVLNNACQILQSELLHEPSRNLNSMPLLRLTSRTRLKSDVVDRGSEYPVDAEPKDRENGGLLANIPEEEASEKKKPNQPDVHMTIHKMRTLLRPDEIWLCSALDLAVEKKPYDVDKLRQAYGGHKLSIGNGVGSDKPTAQDLDSLDFPQENMAQTQLAHGMLIALSPRSVPEGSLTTPRTPRSPRGLNSARGYTPSELTPRFSPRGDSPGTPRSVGDGTPPGTPR